MIKLLIILLFLLTGCHTATTPSPTITIIPTIYKIALDSGHSEEVPGAINLVKEHIINRQTTEILHNLLQYNPNFDVFLTTNYINAKETEDRRSYAENKNADFLISIHANAHETDLTIEGYELYTQLETNKYHNESLKMAKILQTNLNNANHKPSKNTGIFNALFEKINDDLYIRHLFPIEDRHLYDFNEEITFGLLSSNKIPSILIEIGYVHSQNDVDNWMTLEGCKKAAHIYYESICEYYNIEPVYE